jgi:NADH-quinone oxidoreductase subunit J
MTAYLLYACFALGGLGLYLLMPRHEGVRRAPGVAIAVAAVIAWLAVLVWRVIVPDSTTALFCVFAALAVLSAGRVVTHVKPVYTALYFVLTVVAVACLLVLLQAEFLAIGLIIIYAGAILVTYLFVIMLSQQSGSPVYDRSAREPFLSVLAGFVLMAALTVRTAEVASAENHLVTPAPAFSSLTGPIPEGNTAAVGAVLMTRHVVVTQLAAVLLLISMIGAVTLSRRRLPANEVPVTTRGALGQVGREVKPF